MKLPFDKLATLGSKSKLSLTLKRHDSRRDTPILSLLFQPACITSAKLLSGVTFDVTALKINSRRLSQQLNQCLRSESFSPLLIKSCMFLRALIYASGVVDISILNEISLNFDLCLTNIEAFLLIKSRK